MPLNTDSVIQMNSGNDTTTGGADPFTLTLPSTTTAGSTLIIVATADGDNSTTTWLEPPGPAGGETWYPYFTSLAPARSWNQIGVWVKRNVAGGESSWDMTVGLGPHVAQQVVWVVLEVTGIGVDPYPTVNASFPNGWVGFPTGMTINNTNTGVTTWSTGTTEQTACYDVLGLAVHSATSTTGTVPAFSNRTNGWQELITATRTDGSHSMALTVSYLPSLAIGTFECSLDVSPSSYMCGYVLMFYADAAKFAPDYLGMCGFEIGSATNIAVASPAVLNTAIFDTVTGTPAIVATTPRSGSYCLELSSSAAAECLTWTTAINGVLSGPAGGSKSNVGRFCFYFPTSLPAADTPLWETTTGAGSWAGTATVWYRNASQKLEVTVGTTGTPVLSSATIPVNTWVGVDYRHYSGDVSGVHTYDWQIDYDASLADGTGPVAQTQALGGSTSQENTEITRIGWSVAKTATVRYDDIAVSRIWANYPIGDIRLLPLKVDSAGTCTVTGSSANFRTYTSNGGTLTAWTSANTLAALDDIPPTIGAASDGLTQITLAASDWVKIPMETFTAAPDYVLRAVRWYVAGWAASTTTATIAVRSGDASGVLWDVAVGDHNFDNTTQRWLCGPHRVRGDTPPYILTQSKLDGMYLEMGGSTDATPDIGIHCVLAEVAVQPATIIGVIEVEAGAFSVYVRQDPSSGAVASYLVTTPAGTRGAEFTYAIEGVDQTPIYVGPNTTYEEVIGGDSILTVTSVGLSPDASA